MFFPDSRLFEHWVVAMIQKKNKRKRRRKRRIIIPITTKDSCYDYNDDNPVLSALTSFTASRLVPLPTEALKVCLSVASISRPTLHRFREAVAIVETVARRS